MDLASSDGLQLQWRPGRVLLGWLDDATADWLLARSVAGTTSEPAERRRRRDTARSSVDARAPHDLHDDPEWRERPASLDGHATRLADEHTEPGSVSLVDLAPLHALQPYVFTDRAPQLVAPVTLEALADITLPLTSTPDVVLGYDAASMTFRAMSPDQNLQVAGEFSGPLPGAPPGTIGVGFLVGAPPSRLRVKVVEGHPFLVDGYHRAVALLAAGISAAPVLNDGSATFDELWTPGMLGEDVCLATRPPSVGDYLDDSVAASASLAYVGRTVTVSAAELDLGAPERRA